MSLTAEKISTTQQLISNFEKNKKLLVGNKYVQDIREQAIAAFAKQGIPNRKSEEYKYSNPERILADVSKISETKEVNLTKSIITKFQISAVDANIIVLINGIFKEDINSISKLPAGVIICSLKTAFEKYKDLIEHHYSKYANVNADPFTALNTAFANEGLVLVVPDNTVIEKPFHIINIISSGNSGYIYQRNLFVFGKNTEVKVIESNHSLDLNEVTFVNKLSEIVISENSKVLFYSLQDYTSPSPLGKAGMGLLNTTQAHLEKNTHFDTNTITLNGHWVRNNLNIVLNGSNCETHLNGLFITDGDQHIDNHTLVDHTVPHCQSNQLYKGILNGKSTGIFNGKIFVRRDAQKTNAYQSSKNILLSDTATINTKPQLEIYADDVKCSHGSSTGQIDPDAMFYLKARGIGEENAKKLLMLAFAGDVVNTLQIEPLREYISDLIAKRLES